MKEISAFKNNINKLFCEAYIFITTYRSCIGPCFCDRWLYKIRAVKAYTPSIDSSSTNRFAMYRYAIIADNLDSNTTRTSNKIKSLSVIIEIHPVRQIVACIETIGANISGQLSWKINGSMKKVAILFANTDYLYIRNFCTNSFNKQAYNQR